MGDILKIYPQSIWDTFAPQQKQKILNKLQNCQNVAWQTLDNSKEYDKKLQEVDSYTTKLIFIFQN